MSFLTGDAFYVTAAVTLAIVAAMLFVRFTTGDDGWFRWPRPPRKARHRAGRNGGGS